MPSVKASSSRLASEIPMCCQVPGRSVNFRSTIVRAVALGEVEHVAGSAVAVADELARGQRCSLRQVRPGL